MSTNTVTQTRNAVLKDVDTLKNDALQLVTDVKDHANAHVTAKKQFVNDTYQKVREQVTARPVTLLGIGFAVGLLFGWRLRR